MPKPKTAEDALPLTYMLYRPIEMGATIAKNTLIVYPDGDAAIIQEPIKAETLKPGAQLFVEKEIAFTIDLTGLQRRSLTKLEVEEQQLGTKLFAYLGEIPHVPVVEFATEANRDRTPQDLVFLAQEETERLQKHRQTVASLQNPEATQMIADNQFESILITIQKASLYWGLPYEEVLPVVDAPGAFRDTEYRTGFLADWLSRTSDLIKQEGKR